MTTPHEQKNTTKIFAVANQIVKYIEECSDLIEQNIDIETSNYNIRHGCSFLKGALHELEKDYNEIAKTVKPLAAPHCEVVTYSKYGNSVGFN